MTFDARVLTIFPEMFPGLLDYSIPGRALKKGIWNLDTIDIRSFATDKHSTVDDVPFGGGPGMVMRPEVINLAVESVKQRKGKIVYLTPRGEPFSQKLAREIKQDGGVTLICGRYEGIDQRVVEKWNMDEVSIGDFVLSGGELAAQVVLDSVVRLLPGVLGDENSLLEESFESDLLEYSQYTRPQEWEGMKVPEVLVSGHHEKISNWRMSERVKITKKRRPDMYERYILENQK